MEIQARSLIKHYKEKIALNINRLTISSGSLLGIIGPNGAGKSTLARLIAGVDTATSGSIAYDGETMCPSLQQQVTIVFQKPYLFRSTVFNNIAYPLKLRGVNKTEIIERVNSVVRELEIEDISRQSAWTLSGGEAQKVALARALVFRPRLLILDEPTANIDPASIITMERVIKRAHQEENTTVIIVTHNISQAKRLSSEILFMNKGEAVELGRTSEIMQNPSKPLTRQFLEGELIY